MAQDSNKECNGYPSQFYSTETKNNQGEGNLTPYSADYGPGIWATPPAGPKAQRKYPHLLQEAGYTPLNRHMQVVAPLNNLTYPRDGRKKWLVNFIH